MSGDETVVLYSLWAVVGSSDAQFLTPQFLGDRGAPLHTVDVRLGTVRMYHATGDGTAEVADPGVRISSDRVDRLGRVIFPLPKLS